jgi:hypothetical protein
MEESLGGNCRRPKGYPHFCDALYALFSGAHFKQSGKSEYQLSTLLLLCPVVASEDGSPFYMRGEEEVFCANSDLQFSFQGEFSVSVPGIR